MQLFWTFSSMPELSHLDAHERRRLLAACHAQRVYATMALKSMALGWVIGVITGSLLDSPRLVQITCGVAAGLLTTAVVMQIQLCSARAMMRTEIMRLLQGQRAPVCLQCGYDQQGNVNDRCPECGAPTRVPAR